MTIFRIRATLLAIFVMLPAWAASGSDDSIAAQSLDCVINPSVVADLGSGVPGILSQINVDRSDFVEAGDVIAELESGVESAALDLARARSELTAEVDLRRVNAAFGQRQNQRTKDLFQKKAISTNDMDQRQTEARLAHIQLRQAQDNQDLAELELLRAQEILNRRTIRSPIAGVVMDRFKVIGEYVEDQPVVRVAQIDPLHVEVIVPIEQLGMVRKGMSAEVWSEVVQGKKWQATVDRVDQVADVASGTYGVRLTLPNPEYRIPAGLRCRMQLVEKPPIPAGKTTAEAMETVPANAVSAAAKTEKTAPQPDAENKTVSEQALPVQPDSTSGTARTQVKSGTVGSSTRVANPGVVQKIARPLPAGFKAIKREPVGDAVAVGDKPDVAEVRAPITTPEPAQVAVDQAAVQATPAPIVTEADRRAADLIEDDEEVSDLEPVEALPACRLAGPYNDEVQATRKVVALRRAGLSVDIKSMPVSTSTGYMIATPVLGNRAEANALVAKLQAAGITDFYLPKRSNKPLRISLGLYNGRKVAQRQIDKLAKKGFTAELLPWKKKGTQYFLVVRGTPSDVGERLLAGLPVPDTGAESTRGYCNHLAGR